MYVALVQNSKHDVHGAKRGGDQYRFVRQRRLEGLSRTGEIRVDGCRHSGSLLDCVDRRYSLTEREPRSQVERDRDRGEHARMIDRESRGRGLEMSKGR